MTEGDKARLEDPGEFGKSLVEFVERTEFGTSQHEAVADLIDYMNLQEKLRHDYQMLDFKHDPRMQRVLESQARVNELRVALLEHTISQKRSQLKGYAGAYDKVEVALERLVGLISEEANQKFPKDDANQERYLDEIYSPIYRNIQEALNRNTE